MPWRTRFVYICNICYLAIHKIMNYIKTSGRESRPRKVAHMHSINETATMRNLYMTTEIVNTPT